MKSKLDTSDEDVHVVEHIDMTSVVRMALVRPRYRQRLCRGDQKMDIGIV
jgi:hypothetical protein